jgi:uncharacterized membrane protein
MSVNSVFFLAVGMGIVAGLRAMTAPAAVSWAAHLGWLNPHDSLLSFMGSKDIFIAVLEDLVAIGFAFFLVSRG